MDRKQIINEIFENLSNMKRAMVGKKPPEIHGMHQLSHAQMGLLFMLENHGPQSIKQIATSFGMTSSAATQLVNGLVDNKYLKRTVDPHDRRKIAVEITEHNKDLMEKAKQCRLDMMQHIFEALTDEELQQYHQIQRKITQNLNSKYEQSKRAK